jgi:hypothetical protein
VERRRPIGQLASAGRYDGHVRRVVEGLVAGPRQTVDAHQNGIGIVLVEGIRVVAKRAVLADLAARVPRAEEGRDPTVLGAAIAARAELAVVHEAEEVEDGRIVAARLADGIELPVRTGAEAEDGREARQILEAERLLVVARGDIRVLEPEVVAVDLGEVAAVAVVERAGQAPVAAVDEPRRQVIRAIAVRIDGRKHPARARPDAVVSGLAADEELDDLERPDAVREGLQLELETEDGLPLRDVELLLRVEVVGEYADLLRAVAVQLDLAVEPAERTGGIRGEQRNQCSPHQTGPIEASAANGRLRRGASRCRGAAVPPIAQSRSPLALSLARSAAAGRGAAHYRSS